ncbi:DUF6083 domain-containing protein [Streptomyces sp. NPDC003487]
MPSAHSQHDRHWDGSPRRLFTHRSLRMAPTSPSRLLRAGQNSRCRQCGNRVEWFQRHDQRPIALHPHELATAHVPAPWQWHLSGGIAYPHDNGSGWCRIPHLILCPQHIPPLTPDSPRLVSLRRELGLRSRRLIDAGVFRPATCMPATTAPDHDAGITRPVVRILLINYLGEGPVETIRCVAQTRHRSRCTHPVLAAPRGRWVLLPTQPHRGQITLPSTSIAIYDLSHLPYTEQLRWRAQRCPAHAAAHTAADLALAGWQPFDPLLHATYARTELPASAPSTPARHPCHRLRQG